MSADDVIERSRVLTSAPAALRSVVELASFVADVPMATINIVTSDAQHNVAAVGFDAVICRREDSMCAVTVQTGTPILVSDAFADERFRDNPFVTGELGAVRFYASFPLELEGERIGTLCVFDTKPRELDPHRSALLAVLADRIVDILELERQTQHLEQALRRTEELRDELRRSNSQLSAFAGQISHDLSSPLTSVTLALELLHESLADAPGAPPSFESWVETGLRGAGRMEAMIRDILAYARLGGELRRVRVDLGEVAQAARFDVGVFDGDPRIEAGPLPVVLADASQLRAVFQNLFANALKFSGDDPRVEVSSEREGEFWRVEVADRGSGIDPADAVRVFEPLVRARTDVEGSGIGLSTCRRIVQAHGGSIGLRPREGGGAVAWFRLPAALE
ncbi:ATP-binding protein [Microbacterium sp. SORGH_AS_0888]|uniref:sensor histidine kinase n=1 Tax=Microbacterium sp. SORGH_AS_0888 TaxID=3041791 RepID=UPI002784B201|nr:ATP-binding protein [Microbacterium sp. SORGH_AS_0888]MDQ1129803.1 signal transduction histidine kinase [Microbacterium sp. SORGH_AS_0888]